MDGCNRGKCQKERTQLEVSSLSNDRWLLQPIQPGPEGVIINVVSSAHLIYTNPPPLSLSLSLYLSLFYGQTQSKSKFKSNHSTKKLTLNQIRAKIKSNQIQKMKKNINLFKSNQIV